MALYSAMNFYILFKRALRAYMRILKGIMPLSGGYRGQRPLSVSPHSTVSKAKTVV